MNKKRNRSLNWDEEEKQLLCSVLKEYAHAIENKSLDTNTNKIKTKAWEEVYEKFNELNRRHRQLSQLKIQWKTMKVNARKTRRSLKEEITKTGTTTPIEAVIEDLLNSAELLRDHNTYDSDGNIQSSSANKVESANPSETCTITLKDSKPMTCVVKASEIRVNDNIIINQENQQTAVHKRKLFSNNISENGSKSRKEHADYASSTSLNETLKEEEHRRQMEMAEEEHAIKMAIHKEKLKCVILEREILELKKICEKIN